MVGDGYAMGVAPEILEHILGATEGRFRVNHPVFSEQWSEPRSKGFRLSEEFQVSMKGEFAVTKGALERLVELAAKDSAEHLDGKKEVVAWFDPARAISRQPTGWDHAMYMRVKFQFLTPRVQHAEEANLRTEMLGIARDFQKGFRTGAKQEIVDDPLVLQDQRGQMTRKGEDHMDVARREKFSLTCCDPPFPGSSLTLRAVAVPAGVVGDGAMPAASAFIEMTAECRGTTPRNGQEHFAVLPADPLAVSFDEGSSCAADEIGHLEGRPAHLFVPLFVFQLQRVQRTRSRDVRRDGGRWRFLSNRDDLTGSEWCADLCLLRANEWQSSGARCVGIISF